MAYEEALKAQAEDLRKALHRNRENGLSGREHKDPEELIMGALLCAAAPLLALLAKKDEALKKMAYNWTAHTAFSSIESYGKHGNCSAAKIACSCGLSQSIATFKAGRKAVDGALSLQPTAEQGADMLSILDAHKHCKTLGDKNTCYCGCIAHQEKFRADSLMAQVERMKLVVEAAKGYRSMVERNRHAYVPTTDGMLFTAREILLRSIDALDEAEKEEKGS